MRIHAHIRRNIASRRSEGDVCRSMSKIAQAMFEAQPQRSLATPEHFQVCECKSTTAIPMKKRKKVAANFHSCVTI